MANLGAKHHASKMTTAKVRQARKSYDVRTANGDRKWTITGLAEKYGITPQSMAAILNRKSWKHVS
ncbi:hypothetical protein ACFY7C_19130 [Streptomyces sp. NPDC012769]|uniref:hypothetical protein n=1 Tax=Streptomyces sp. NPDC012769 TaxID=3364848 RepID=UPI003679124F